MLSLHSDGFVRFKIHPFLHRPGGETACKTDFMYLRFHLTYACPTNDTHRSSAATQSAFVYLFFFRSLLAHKHTQSMWTTPVNWLIYSATCARTCQRENWKCDMCMGANQWHCCASEFGRKLTQSQQNILRVNRRCVIAIHIDILRMWSAEWMRWIHWVTVQRHRSTKWWGTHAGRRHGIHS